MVRNRKEFGDKFEHTVKGESWVEAITRIQEREKARRAAAAAEEMDKGNEEALTNNGRECLDIAS
jgi:hypothetical protein